MPALMVGAGTLITRRMQITRAFLEQQLKSVRDGKAQALANLHASEGAEQMLLHMLEQEAKPEPDTPEVAE